MGRLSCVIAAGVFATAGAATLIGGAPGPDSVRALYTKHEYYIPMRDGVRLYTAIYAPKDQSRAHPILLTRTPYSISPYGPDQYRASLGPSQLFTKEGYIVASRSLS